MSEPQQISTTPELQQVQQPRTFSWRQGFTIALGVPVLILPSISVFSGMVGVFAIFVWLLSVFQGFMQNLAYGEMASRYPNVSGLPGFAQAVFKSKKGSQHYGITKFIGGFSAWGYWFAWNPVLAIFSITLSDYMLNLIPAFAGFDPKILAIITGIVIFAVLILVNHAGFGGGASLGYLMAALSLIPLFVISIAAFFSGSFNMANVTTQLFPDTWTWDLQGVFLLFGIFAIAQWSACAWETAAIYAPQYKKPKKDIPKALFGCGLVCIFSYILVQLACTGVLGVDGIEENYFAPMYALANITLGGIGSIVAIVMLLAAMVLIIQTALLGSSSAMAGMSEEGNLPRFFGRRNRHGVPMTAMITVCLLNVVFIIIGDSAASILAASALGYVIANGISLFSYVKAHIDLRKEGKKKRDNDEIFHAPPGWTFVAGFFGVLNIPLYLVGIMIINFLDYGVAAALIGIVILAFFVPL